VSKVVLLNVEGKAGRAALEGYSILARVHRGRILLPDWGGLTLGVKFDRLIGLGFQDLGFAATHENDW
jgi:hypothetical protein